MLCLIINTHNFQGDLTDESAKTKSLRRPVRGDAIDGGCRGLVGSGARYHREAYAVGTLAVAKRGHPARDVYQA